MRYFIDTEFDGFGGDLISMALVREDGHHRYWVLQTAVNAKNEWVINNVLPLIYKGSPQIVVNTIDLSRQIYRFLKKDQDITIIADWPDDIKYFCSTMVFGAGQCRGLTKVKFQFDRQYGSSESKYPHNALYDALAIEQNYMKNFS